MDVLKRCLRGSIVLGLASSGCGGKPSSPPPTRPTPIDREVFRAAVADAPARAFYLDVYHVVVPVGTITRNEEFWRRVDEEPIDPATKDLLLKNGVRTGLAANGDWEFFKDVIEGAPHFARSGSAVATGSGKIELPMKENVPEQTIWFISDRFDPYGQTYERCADLIGVSFWPDPRRPGEMRLSLSPTVRSNRIERTFSLLNDERFRPVTTPEYLYQLNLRLNIQSEKFLVLGMSPEGMLRQSSLGHQFLTLEGGPEMREQVLIFVPRVASRRSPAATRSAPDVNVGREKQAGPR